MVWPFCDRSIGDFPWLVAPPSSAYWIHKSASTCSKALRNVRMAMSPLVGCCGPFWAAKSPGNRLMPTPTAPTPTTLCLRNERRFLLERVRTGFSMDSLREDWNQLLFRRDHGEL